MDDARKLSESVQGGYVTTRECRLLNIGCFTSDDNGQFRLEAPLDDPNPIPKPSYEPEPLQPIEPFHPNPDQEPVEIPDIPQTD